MADLGKFFQNVRLKAQEAIGNAASDIATNTKTKVNEINLATRRSEIMSSLGEKAYEIWKSGEAFPAELDQLLKEVSDIDAQADAIKAERAAAAKAKEEAAAKARAEAEAKKQQQKAPTLVVPEEEEAPAEEKPAEEPEEREAPVIVDPEETAEAEKPEEEPVEEDVAYSAEEPKNPEAENDAADEVTTIE